MSWGFLWAATALLGACQGPTYPQCETDDHCQTQAEVCVNGSCQECRDDTHCTAKYPDESRVCVDGRCDEDLECRTDADCTEIGSGLVCQNNTCVPECIEDADCTAGFRCQENQCVASDACQDDAACGPGRHCQEGRCLDGDAAYQNVSSACRPVDPNSGDSAALGAVSFDFNRYELTVEARNVLEQNVECLRQIPGLTVTIEGHCDERGTQEYNLALGEKRANTVVAYLKNLGIDTARLQTRSKGENEPLCNRSTESCWAQNRRVEFVQ